MEKKAFKIPPFYYNPDMIGKSLYRIFDESISESSPNSEKYYDVEKYLLHQFF